MATENMSYAHANMRLKTRYGMEISFEEWRALGDLFRRNDPKVQSPRKNHVGDVEGWVKINGIWVCCYYSSYRSCISTFYARPPDLVETPKSKAEVLKDLEKRKARCRAACAKVLNDAQARASEIIKEAKARKVQVLQASQASDAKDAGWFKVRMYEVLQLIQSGQLHEAANLAEAVAYLPRSMRPSLDHTAVDSWVATRRQIPKTASVEAVEKETEKTISSSAGLSATTKALREGQEV